MIGYNKEEGIQIVPHNPLWKKRAQDEMNRIRKIIGSEEKIEHFGSTAIHGCAAKDIIDIMIFCGDDNTLQEVKGKLMPIYQGFSSLESQRKGFMCFDKCVEILGSSRRTHHIHLIIDKYEWDRKLAFRDYLNANPDEVKRYEKIKLEATKVAKFDMTRYSQMKNEFIDEIIGKSE